MVTKQWVMKVAFLLTILISIPGFAAHPDSFDNEQVNTQRLVSEGRFDVVYSSPAKAQWKLTQFRTVTLDSAATL